VAEIPPKVEPSHLLRRLVAAGVDFVVIGGVAVILLGSARNTKDVDITFATDQRNLDALGGVLVELNARLRGIDEPLPFIPDGRTLRNISLLTLDTEPPGGPPYDELRARASDVDIGGATVRVADIDDLIAMKKAAGRLRDLADIDELEAIKELRHESGP
jgi:hypothetical protein